MSHTQRVDDLGDTPRDILLRKQLHTAVAHLDLLSKVAQLRLLAPAAWGCAACASCSPSRRSTPRFSERQEFTTACAAVLARHPLRIVVSEEARSRIWTAPTPVPIAALDTSGTSSGGSSSRVAPTMQTAAYHSNAHPTTSASASENPSPQDPGPSGVSRPGGSSSRVPDDITAAAALLRWPAHIPHAAVPP